MTNLSSSIVLLAALCAPAAAAGTRQAGAQQLGSARQQQSGTAQKFVVPIAPPNPLPISALPFTITQPGYYQVTHDLTGVAGQNGITVSATPVVIDLNGFTLEGGNGSKIGIAGNLDTVVLNGRLEFWGEEGIYCGERALIAGVGVDFSGKDGILLEANSTVQDCSVRSSGADGIRGHALTVLHSRIEGSTGHGIEGAAVSLFVAACKISGNQGDGIQAPDHAVLGNVATVEQCLVFENKGTGIDVSGRGSRVSDCTVRKNDDFSIILGPSGTAERCTLSENRYSLITNPGCRIEACAIDGNTSGGIFAGDDVIIVDCRVTNCGGPGILVRANAIIERCHASRNEDGIVVDGVFGIVQGCTVTYNTARGIDVFSGAVVSNNTVVGNLGVGIGTVGPISRIENNHIATNGVGIEVLGAENLIVRNSLSHNTVQMQIAPNNMQGPFIKTKGFIQSENPWANFDLSFPTTFP